MRCLSSFSRITVLFLLIQSLSTESRSLILNHAVQHVVADGVLALHLVVRHAGVVEPVTPDDILIKE